MLLNSALISLFLSTPSARRATEKAYSHRSYYPGISIHALREEGDKCSQSRRDGTKKFLSTPSARRATKDRQDPPSDMADFYPRPPRGGRRLGRGPGREARPFLSTPSARRATYH